MHELKANSLNIVKNIPQIPEEFKKVNEILREQGNSIESIVDYLNQNNTLKEDIIKLSNSKFYTIWNQNTSIKGAILGLGIMKVKNMIMVLSLKKLMDLDGNNFDDLWVHSIKCAIACNILANENCVINPDDAFALGFLHDIGKIVLYKNNPELYRSFNNKILDNNEDIIALENDFFNTNHSIEGSMILKKWNMPKILTDCITYHHTPTLSTIPSASGIIYFADQIVKSNRQEPILESNMFNRLGFYINDAKSLKINIDVKSEFYLSVLN